MTQLRPEDVQDIVSLLDSLSYDELDIATSELRVSLRRSGQGWTQDSRVLSAPNILHTDVSEPAAAEPDNGAAARRTAQGDDAVPPGLHAIRAPLPGTFYRAPKPGADPYVDVGSRVDEETVVGLIETMKLFNSVYADVRGVVVEFLVDDAEFADKDAAVVLIRPDEA